MTSSYTRAEATSRPSLGQSKARPPQPLGRRAWLTGLCALLALTLAPQAPAAQSHSGLARWEPEIRAFEASDRTNPPPQHAILFIGSSSFRMWKDLPQAFPDKQVINRGFGGSEIADSTAFASRIIFPYHPRMIVLYAGDNDLAAGKSPRRVVADYAKFVRTVHAKLPDTTIAFLSIKPSPVRWQLKNKIVEANQKIAAMKGAHLAYIDVYHSMLGPDGNPRKDLFKKDGLHPNAQAYKMWTAIIRPYLN